MTEQSRGERWAAADIPRADAQWGMRYAEDSRDQAPEVLAHDAWQRGDAYFQIDVLVASYQGNIAVASSWSRIWRPPQYDHVGAIERQGWQLQNMSSCFVPRGASHNRNVGSAEYSTHGDLLAIYVFRRPQATAAEVGG